MNPNERQPQETTISTGSIAGLVEVEKVHIKLSEEVIITTEDKVRLCLGEHLKRIEKKKGWIAPLGILMTIILTLVTASFRDALFEAVAWKYFFIFAGVASFVWLGLAVKEAFHSEKLEDVVSELKKGSKLLRAEQQ